MNHNIVITINEGEIILTNNLNVEVKKEEVLNTTIWTFNGDITNIDNAINHFIKMNNRYVIAYNEMPLEKLVVNELVKKNYKISFAESCTGGMLVSTIINVSGASNVIDQSYVTYSDESKIKLLNVNKQTIKKYSVYSPEVAEEMAHGLYIKTNANICVSVTGRAGGDEYNDGDGTCDFAFLINNDNQKYLQVEHYSVQGNRNEVRKMQTTYILWRILLRLKSLNLNN